MFWSLIPRVFQWLLPHVLIGAFSNLCRNVSAFIQSTVILMAVKSATFLFFARNINCGYLFEPAGLMSAHNL